MAAQQERCLYEALNVSRYGLCISDGQGMLHHSNVSSHLKCFLLQGGHHRRH